MLTAERKQLILEILQQEGKVYAPGLSQQMGVSEDTIRRDLRDLAEAGLLQRVHGGALLKSPAATTYAARQTQTPQAKNAIARAAASLVKSGQVVFLDGGTTTLQVANHLPADLRGTVITNSPPHATALAEHPHLDVILIGGRILKESLVTIGAGTVEAIREIRADICFLGVCCVHYEAGITIPNLEESYVKRAMIAASAEVVALASTEKLETVATFAVAPLSELTHLVTESTAPEAVLQRYQQLGIKTMLV